MTFQNSRILLKYGADLNAQAPDRQDHRTALHFALLSGSADLVKFLIGKGAMVNMPEEYEKPSPIDIAVLKDDPELLKVRYFHRKFLRISFFLTL